MTTPTAQVLGVQAESEQSERDRTAVLAPVDFVALFASLPESDPDRHDFDPLDAAFAHLAPGYPQAEQCWCGHPESRHWTAEHMTLGAGCHDCAGWNGAHRFGSELPWTSEAGDPR